MQQINIEDVIRIQEQRRAINKFDVDEVSFNYRGNHIYILKEEIEEWKYTGLSLIDFIEMVIVPEYLPLTKTYESGRSE
jgi:hypothetical protein